MSQANPLVTGKRSYYFTRAKDTHIEEGQVFITLFARLTCVEAESTTSRWVEIEEVKWIHAHASLKAMPNGIHTFKVTCGTFQELTELANFCCNEMYYLNPAYEAAKFRPVRSKRWS
ncbi:hypothetical protein [Planococcus lenghuensis]|uniref:Uncharacterized protein n=1 Tax=Planococcus lenghuensis TaxID=2213202 RepID=A0A1Q2KYZ5_9BACL|nr:hypothetical protein [Planococcus lenghuensis]AQQ53411.1 hypothetical protein B0X71_10225 [Planococcus lenghuensis]